MIKLILTHSINFKGQWTAENSDYEPIENEKDFHSKLELIKAQNRKYIIEKETKANVVKPDTEIDLSEIQKTREMKQKNIKLHRQKGNIQLSFAWNTQIITTNIVRPTDEQKKILRDKLNAEKQKETPNLDDLQIKEDDTKSEKSKSKAEDIGKPEDEKKEETKSTPKENTPDDTSNSENKDNKTSDDDKNPVKADEGKNDAEPLYNPDFWNLDRSEMLQIPEIKEIIDDDGNGLDDKSYTYFDYEANNKLYLILKIYDDKYDDEHRLTIYFPLNFKNEITNIDEGTQIGDINKSESIDSSTNENEDGDKKKDTVDTTNDSDNKTKNTDNTKDTKITEEDTKDAKTDTENSKEDSEDTKKDSPDSKKDETTQVVNVDEENKNPDSATPNDSKNPILNYKKLSINFQSALVEPNYMYTRVNAYKFFNFDKSFHCKFKGYLKFQNSIFSQNNLKKTQIIHINKLKKIEDLIELRLYSSESGCNFNISATAHFEKSDLLRKTIFFVFFVILIGRVL